MARADYRLCDVCDDKAFYDANLNYDFEENPETGLWQLGAWVVLCSDCAKTHDIQIVPKGIT
jgi:hypothetical protein